MYKKSFGQSGENYAEHFLVSKGYTILAKNFRSRFGEIDIIAMENDTLVFVEVKTRSGKKYGKPEEAVTPLKMKHIIKAAEYYMMLNKNYPKKQRIDVVAIETKDGKLVSAKIIKAT